MTNVSAHERIHRWLLPSFLMLGLCVIHPATPCDADTPRKDISFVNDVVPVLTKAGCNAGVCHAKAGGGQNGFQLSLLGFEPLEDYQHLVHEGRGRRLFPLDPARSLLLAKAAGEVPHGGGVRIEKGSPNYNTLLRWIQAGSPYRSDNDPELVSIRVEPPAGTLQPGESLTLRSIATFSDGSTRDVTATSLFESNDSAMATVNESGHVTAMDLPGKVSVMVRHQDRVAVYNASIPLGQPVDAPPSPNNFVDELVFANLEQLGIPPSDLCDDATFLRRVSLDIGGRVPTEREARAFAADDSPDKRAKVVDRLLRSPDYADYFANKWTALLKNRRDDASDITSNFAFHAWVRDNLLAGTPYDQLVRELLAATGTVIANPPVAWYKRVKEPKQQIEDVAQLFLGVRLQCAQCHHHPFERWSQTDYYSLAAFFSRIGRKPTDTAGEDLIFHQRGTAQAVNMKTGENVPPAALGDSVGAIPADEDPRLRLADWMASPGNPFFAKSLVNRYWKHFFRRGLIEPEDDIRDTNPPTNPELLAALEQHFVESGFDLRSLIRVITTSKAYQLSAIPNDHNLVDSQNYSRYYPKRLQAEVMLDAIDQVAGTQTSFANLPIGTRAVALPDNSYNKASPFLRVFGRPEATSVCECERVQSGSLAQSLHLMNAGDIKSKLAAGGGRINRLVGEKTSADEKVTELYFAAFSRSPSDAELATALQYLNEPRTDANGKPLDATTAERENLQDLTWALLNTKEFLFNH
ncbi:DUF1549 domain-containing protein [Stieleria sp. ICT_E10.1]|uniref:DUF1549 domain-containing protein n=1 Tax=Stieleria sedimenti TaxID=2976331 RepID=UPI0021804423|nr:DUF1549 domain-containing protein [Stieleria sedimenti]MCS7465411.1 DUF1549 domain-containing protein [Stieleria sedimenti]